MCAEKATYLDSHPMYGMALQFLMKNINITDVL